MSRVAIIGAGIGGLVAAIGLQRQGWQVTVHERASAPAAVGAGLSLFGNAFTALDSVGAGDAVRALASPRPGRLAGPGPGQPAGSKPGEPAGQFMVGQRRPDGRWLAVSPPGALGNLLVVHRADLHAVLEAQLEPGTVRYGQDVSVGAGGGLTGGVGAGADVVVAADGLRSRTRASWPGDPGLRYSGYTSWRGVTRHPVDVLGGTGETLGRGDRFGVVPLPDGRVYWFGASTVPAGTAFADEYAEVRRRFAGWHAPIAALLDATDPVAVIRTDIHDLAAPLRTFRRGRTVLLGDAAHAMTPNLGQGAALAMEDAAVLSHVLGTVPIDEALDAYDRLRRARTQPIAARSRLLGWFMQSRSPLRDVVLRLVPVSVASRQIAALQNWSV